MRKLASMPVNKNPIYTCDNFALYHGVGSKMNDKGLMLQLNSTLLSGDCQFDYWPQGFGKTAKSNPKYRNPVFPHHGAHMKDTNNRIDCLENSSDTKVIVPTGYNPHYGHPADNSNIFSIRVILFSRQIQLTGRALMQVTVFLLLTLVYILMLVRIL